MSGRPSSVGEKPARVAGATLIAVGHLGERRDLRPDSGGWNGRNACFGLQSLNEAEGVVQPIDPIGPGLTWPSPSFSTPAMRKRFADECRPAPRDLHPQSCPVRRPRRGSRGGIAPLRQLADQPWRSLIRGIERACSIALDFHKWLTVPYAVGACLISDRNVHKLTFSNRPAYLAGQTRGLAAGDLWFCDYGFDLSRPFHALKVWTCIKAAGTKRLGAAISDNCRQAALLGELVSDATPIGRAPIPSSNHGSTHPRVSGTPHPRDSRKTSASSSMAVKAEGGLPLRRPSDLLRSA